MESYSSYHSNTTTNPKPLDKSSHHSTISSIKFANLEHHGHSNHRQPAPPDLPTPHPQIHPHSYSQPRSSPPGSGILFPAPLHLQDKYPHGIRIPPPTKETDSFGHTRWIFPPERRPQSNNLNGALNGHVSQTPHNGILPDKVVKDCRCPISHKIYPPCPFRYKTFQVTSPVRGGNTATCSCPVRHDLFCPLRRQQPSEQQSRRIPLAGVGNSLSSPGFRPNSNRSNLGTYLTRTGRVREGEHYGYSSDNETSSSGSCCVVM